MKEPLPLSLCWLAAAAWPAASLSACLLHICSQIPTAHTHPQRPVRRGVFS